MPQLPELGDRQDQPHQVHLPGDGLFLADLLQAPIEGVFRGHCHVNRHSFFFDVKSILASTNNQRLSRHVDHWNFQEIS